MICNRQKLKLSNQVLSMFSIKDDKFLSIYLFYLLALLLIYYFYVFILILNIQQRKQRRIINSIKNTMRHTLSEKKLYNKPQSGDARTFYKNFKLKTIKTQYKLDPKLDYEAKYQAKRNKIRIEKTPWNSSITQKDIGYLMKRLTDTPECLYKAFEKKNKQNFQVLNSKNKFKPLTDLSIHSQNDRTQRKQNKIKAKVHNNLLNMSTGSNKIRLWNQREDKSRIKSSILSEKQKMQRNLPKLQAKTNTQHQILLRIQGAKKRYIEQYRKMLLGMKSINLDTDLPRIKYVQQNQQTNRINIMHGNSKL